MKRKQLEKKKRSTVRERDWERHGDTAFSRDLVKHRRALAKLSDASIAQNVAALPTDFEPNALLISHSKKWAFVRMFDASDGLSHTHVCLIDERLQEGRESLLAPGDRVYVETEENDIFVRGVAPRTTTLSRPAGEHDRVERQVLAANVDLLVVVAAAAHPPFRPGLVDRYLIAAEIGGVQSLLCLNKRDLVEEEPEDLEVYRKLGIPVIITSCTTGQGIDELRRALQGKFSVLSGHSGVGKSSLLNALDPSLEIFTQEVSSQTLKGRHTTTAAQLYHLMHGDIRIIDTPGIRTLGLWKVTPEEVAYYFPEIADASRHCHFRNCTHIHEPVCGVKEAVDAGTLPATRYASYVRLRASLASENNITPGRMKQIVPREFLDIPPEE